MATPEEIKQLMSLPVDELNEAMKREHLEAYLIEKRIKEQYENLNKTGGK